MNLIPAGFYRAVAVALNSPDGETFVQFGESKNGNPQVVVNFEILEGEQAGRRIAWFGYFTEKTAPRTVESLRYCGFVGNDLAAAVTQQLDQEVQIVVGHEDYQGKTSAKVQWVNRGGGDGYRLEKSMDRNALRQFAAQMKGAVMSAPEVAGKKAERGAPPKGNGPPPLSEDQKQWTTPAPDGGRVADDDIPF